MKVKAVGGIGDTVCQCGDWLSHWQRFSGLVPFFCSEVSCARRADVGAHVQKADCTDGRRYIVPLCSAHHVHADTLHIIDSAMLVPVEPEKTCARV